MVSASMFPSRSDIVLPAMRYREENLGMEAQLLPHIGSGGANSLCEGRASGDYPSAPHLYCA